MTWTQLQTLLLQFIDMHHIFFREKRGGQIWLKRVIKRPTRKLVWVILTFRWDSLEYTQKRGDRILKCQLMAMPTSLGSHFKCLEMHDDVTQLGHVFPCEQRGNTTAGLMFHKTQRQKAKKEWEDEHQQQQQEGYGILLDWNREWLWLEIVLPSPYKTNVFHTNVWISLRSFKLDSLINWHILDLIGLIPRAITVELSHTFVINRIINNE